MLSAAAAPGVYTTMLTNAAVESLKGLDHHLYEDRFRLLGAANRLVAETGRGHIYAVMDGVGGAPLGMRAAQLLADRLLDFYRLDASSANAVGLFDLIVQASAEAHSWGMIEDTDRPLAAAAITVAWLAPAGKLHVFHAGDTLALLYDGSKLRKLCGDTQHRRAIAHYLGQEGFEPEHHQVACEEGDVLCLVTDGVTKGLKTDHIQAVLEEYPEPAHAVRELVRRARGRGSRDDITALVVEIEEL